MTITMERPTETLVVPDARHGVRILPTWEEQEVIDLYAEGYAHCEIAVQTGMSTGVQKHMLQRLRIPFPDLSCHPDRPRYLTPAEIVAGDSGWLEQRTAAQMASVESGGWLDRRIAALDAANMRDAAQR